MTTFALLILCSTVYLFAQQSELDSRVAPPNYVLKTIQEKSFTDFTKKAASNADILLVQTSLPWNSSANTEVLDALEYIYDIADISNISDIDMFAYPVVLVVNDQTQTFYDIYANKREEFDEYVLNGGTLLFFAASDGWARGTLQTNLPGNVEVVTPHYENNNYINNEEHPIVTGILSDKISLSEGDLYGTYCSHGYFRSLPEGADVILIESHGYPTLVEYSLGKGKVLASTLTWEHAFSYGRVFGSKALDDVFLYMFSEGYQPSKVDIDLKLRIEDANPQVMVNKIEGSYADVILKVQNNGEQSIENCLISLHPDVGDFYDQLVVYRRDNQADVILDKLSTGIMETVIPRIEPGESFELVHRFLVKENVIISQGISIDILDIDFSGEIVVDNRLFESNSSILRLWERLGSMIVTNRDLLFEKYDDNEVSALLAKLYEISAFGNEVPGIVYNIERYSELAANWKQEVDYSERDAKVVNETALEIDQQIEAWYNHSVVNWVVVGVKPSYLTIVGGDEIIPFYRVDDGNYNIKSVPESRMYRYEFQDDPIHKAYKNNYFLTDNVFADMDHSFHDAEKGNLDISIGRIVGLSARDMQKLVENGVKGPSILEHSLLTSMNGPGGYYVGGIKDAVKDHDSEILGLSNPDLVGNDNWTRNEFYTSLQKDYQIFMYMAHSDYDVLELNNDISYSDELEMDEMINVDFNNYHRNNPFVYLMSCHSGVVTSEDGNHEADDCIPYKLVHLGASGMVGSSGFSYGNPVPSVFYKSDGEELVNHFFHYLWGDYARSNGFGRALTLAKSAYNFGLSDQKSGRKTILEFNYYGLPWASINSTKGIAKKSAEVVSETLPDTMKFIVNQYEFFDFEKYEILEIPGLNQHVEEADPMVPYFTRRYALPKGSVVNNLKILTEESTNLGAHTIPQVVSMAMQAKENFTDDYSFDIFPENRIVWEIKELDNYDELVVNYCPVLIDGNTKEVTLFTETVIGMEMDFSKDVMVKEFEASGRIYGLGEEVIFDFNILNLTNEDKTLNLSIAINEVVGGEFQEVISGKTTNSKQISWSGDLPEGMYLAVLEVRDDQDVIVAGGIVEVTFVNGNIETFDVPDTIARNKNASIGLQFSHYLDEVATGIAYVEIYDQSGEHVVNLIKQTKQLAAQSMEEYIWNWSTTELEPGNYRAKGYIELEEKLYGPVEESFVITKSVSIKAIHPENLELSLCNSTELQFDVEVHQLDGVQFHWFFNDIPLPDQTNDTLSLSGLTESDEGEYHCMIHDNFDTIYTDRISLFMDPVIETSERVEICEGVKYLSWDATGIYERMLISQDGCDSVVHTNLTVHPSPEVFLGKDTTVVRTIELDAGDGYLSYAWNTDDHSQKIIVDESYGFGIHELIVEVTDLRHCLGSDTIEVNLVEFGTDVPFYEETKISIYPNPTRGILFVDIPDREENLHIQLISIHGTVVLDRIYQPGIGQVDEIDISGYVSGIYFMRLGNENKNHVAKIILE